MKQHRLRCRLLGCVEAEDYPGCHFCGVANYDPDYIDFGKLEWLFRLRWHARRLLRKLQRRKCQHCGRKFWIGYDNELCSEECHEDWLPF